MIAYDYSQGFPNNWVTTQLEQEYAKKLFANHFPKSKNGMVVNCTWKEEDTKQEIIQILDRERVDAVLIFNFVDEYDKESWSKFVSKCKKRAKRVLCAGHIIGKVQFQFWPLAVQRFFTQYNIQDLTGDLTQLYVCYNRKPHDHRVELYDSFKKHELLDQGTYTLGSEEGDGVYYGVPNDLMSLGNMDVWRSSALCIVNETIYSTNTVDGFPFLTEKTFKPIVGCKPFIILGPNGAVEYLEQHGFKTYNKHLGLPDDPTVNDITECIKSLTIDDVRPLYELAEYNLKHFNTYCKNELARLGLV
jgi:hypothetical protein